MHHHRQYCNRSRHQIGVETGQESCSSATPGSQTFNLRPRTRTDLHSSLIPQMIALGTHSVWWWALTIVASILYNHNNYKIGGQPFNFICPSGQAATATNCLEKRGGRTINLPLLVGSWWLVHRSFAIGTLISSWPRLQHSAWPFGLFH